jgi:succinate dehydrogenase/fumarate reductase flavoprotein subunit
MEYCSIIRNRVREMSGMTSKFENVDMLVIGAGAGGMTAALTGAISGLKVVLCEKTNMVGGTTSTSGGTTWIPGTSQSVREGVADNLDDAAAFLNSVIQHRGGDELRTAFLQSGPTAVDMLEQQSEVKFIAAKAHPDYLGGHPGAAYGGRALVPVPFDGKQLGADFDRVRPPRSVFMGLSGMMVGRNELASLLNPFSSVKNLKEALSVVLPYFSDRLFYKRGTRLLMGNALVGRLLYSLKQKKVPIYYETSLKEFIFENGRITGAIFDTPNGPIHIKASKGVVLATGGVAWSNELRSKLFPPEIANRSQSPTSNTGDGIMIATKSAGARLDNGHDSPGLWMPCSIRQRQSGEPDIWPHIILDRAKPGLIAVGANGRRFVNESDSYHDFCIGMIKAKLSEAWLIVDDKFIQKYGLGLVLPGAKGLKKLLNEGYLLSGSTINELARKAGIDENALKETISNHNADALNGEDTEFGRGTSVMNRFNGDDQITPNPCLSPITTGPYYALKVQPIDLASSAGLACNIYGNVLRDDDSPIEGLYACGNDMTSLFRGTYPGPGTTIGVSHVISQVSFNQKCHRAWRVQAHLSIGSSCPIQLVYRSSLYLTQTFYNPLKLPLTPAIMLLVFVYFLLLRVERMTTQSSLTINS